jgi:hypothetical protein
MVLRLSQIIGARVPVGIDIFREFPKIRQRLILLFGSNGQSSHQESQKQNEDEGKMNVRPPKHGKSPP